MYIICFNGFIHVFYISVFFWWQTKKDEDGNIVEIELPLNNSGGLINASLRKVMGKCDAYEALRKKKRPCLTVIDEEEDSAACDKEKWAVAVVVAAELLGVKAAISSSIDIKM